MTDYDAYISKADLAGLVPAEYSNEMLDNIVQQSACMRLARRLRDMPRSVRTMPVTSALPTAYFVTEVEKKKTTEVTWANKNITAEELAVIVPVPQAAFDDSNYPIWDAVKPLIETAAGKAIDQAVMYGTNAPSSWQTDLGSATGILGGATAKSHVISLAAKTDLYEAVMDEGGLLSLVEEDGFITTGHIAHTSIKGKLRGCRDANGQPIFKSGPNFQSTFATGELDGAPILYPLNGACNSASALMISGQFSELVFAMRQDINWMVSDQGVISDGSGVVIQNLFQQDMIALRMTIRLGFALPAKINFMSATPYPFAVLTA
jgi:HK97 family phage major capsid protein